MIKKLFLIKIEGLAAALVEATVMVGMRLFGGIILTEFSFYKNFETVGPGANACRAVLGLSGRSSCSECSRIILDCLLCPVERHLCCNSNSGPLEEQLFTPKPSISPALKDLSQTGKILSSSPLIVAPMGVT